MLLLALACVPLPYIAPPLDLCAAIDPRPTSGLDDELDWPTSIDLRAGIAPLAFIDELQDRRIDPTAGFVATIDTRGDGEHTLFGGYARVAMRTAYTNHGKTFTAIEPRVTLDVVTNSRARLGGDLLLGVAFRVGGWSESETGGSMDISGGWIGISHGEWGFAATMDLGGRYTPAGEFDARMLFGVEIRPPAAAGVLIVPVWQFL